jgi:predicted lipoprotein
MQSWGDDFLLPTYADVHDRTVELEAASATLCAEPSAEHLTAAQQAWTDARAPWKRTEVFAFGPYKEEPLRLGPKIDAWPVRPASVQAVLDGDLELTPEVIDGLGVYSRGFPAIEYLLFAIDVTAEPRGCAYLLAVTANLSAEVAALRDAWAPDGGDYLAELTGAGKTSAAFDTLPEALGEVVNRMGFTAENIHVDKLGRPVGATSGDGSPQPELAESQFSGRSVTDILDNLDGIERLFFGAGAAPGLTTYLHKRGFRFDVEMQGALGLARLALGGIELPLVDAVGADPGPVIAAMDRVTDLQILLQTEIIPALSLTVGFNDVDGD